MSGRPSYAEQYGRAVHSSDLRHVDWRTADVDRLAALAWVDRRLASPMFRSAVANDAREVRRLRELWHDECGRMALRRGWDIRVREIRVIAHRSLTHWLFGVCTACGGRRYRLWRDVLAERGHVDKAAVIGRDVLSDDPCPACASGGRLAAAEV